MKKVIYTLFIALGIFTVANAQNDTLLYENFNYEFDSVLGDFGAQDGVVQFASGNDTTFINFDADGIAAAGGSPGNWYWDFEPFQPEDSTAQGGILISKSWLDGYAPGNRNWLILPPVSLGDSSGVFSWKSATYQGPRYMDGYTVLVSVGSNDPTTSGNFTDTLFQAASMDGIIGSGLSVDSFTYTPGYIHGNGFTDLTTFIHGDSVGATIHYGLLEAHSVSLANYAGQTIYIAILHDADDDNLISVDDLLVTGTKPSTTSTQPVALDADLNIFPNPADQYLNISYEVKSEGKVSAQIIDMQGRLVRSLNSLSTVSGQHQETINIKDLAVGTYNLVLTQDGKIMTKQFVKQ